MPALRTGLEKWFERYNEWRPHEALGNLTPDAVYRSGGVETATQASQMILDAA